VQTNLRNQDKECQHFIAFIGSLQRILAKHSKKEITQKRHSMLIDKNLLSTKNCLAVLEASKKEPWKDEMDGEERFFLSTAGRQIHSASNDLSCWRKVYERWEKRQLKLRQECVRSHFPWRQPTHKRLEECVAKQAWAGKTGSQRLLERWTPSGSEDNIMDCKQIQTLVRRT
ncbi:Hypothetical protein SMAX5B_000581, partial [Scophthalmus maximus]